MAKTVKFILIVFLILLLTAAVFRHTICRILIETALMKLTGIKISIEYLYLDVLKNSLLLQGVTIYNPDGFRDENLAVINRLLIKYNLPDFFQGKLHFPLIKADIPEINIIKNTEKSLNVAVFKNALSTKEQQASTEASSNKTQPNNLQGKLRRSHPKLTIDRFELSPIKVTIINYQAGSGQPAVVIFSTKEPSVYENVENLMSVVDSVYTEGKFNGLFNNLLNTAPAKAIKTTGRAIKGKINGLISKTE